VNSCATLHGIADGLSCPLQDLEQALNFAGVARRKLLLKIRAMGKDERTQRRYVSRCH
jgi:hypothetical protein